MKNFAIHFSSCRSITTLESFENLYGQKLSEGAVGVRHFGDNSENEAADGAPNRRSNHDKAAEWPE